MPNITYLPDVLQLYDYDCGIVCVQTILAYYGEDRDEVKLLSEIEICKDDGAETNHIIEYLENKGYKVKAGKMTIKDLKKYVKKMIPVIIFIQAWSETKVDYSKSQDNGHYVIVRGYNKKGLIIEDPAIFGRGFISYKELDKRWHGEDIDILENYGIAVWGKKPFNYKKLIKIK